MLIQWNTYTAMRITKLLLPVTTWMKPTNIILIERNDTQKSTYCMIPLYIVEKQE